jgi:hypothetical protein
VQLGVRWWEVFSTSLKMMLCLKFIDGDARHTTHADVSHGHSLPFSRRVARACLAAFKDVRQHSLLPLVVGCYPVHMTPSTSAAPRL